jgi:mono/diheme cytochrome c family protein
MSDHPSSASDYEPGPGGPAGDAAPMSDSMLQMMHEQLLRDKEEPSEGFSLVPIFLIFLLCVLVYVCGIYVATHSGGFRWNVYDENWRPGEASAIVVEDPIKAGARVFAKQCQQCHGPAGLGQPGAYPPLAGSPWPVGNPDRPISIVLAGMSGPINVLGNAINNTMPAVGASLKDQDIANVLSFVRASFGNQDVPVDESEVSEIRAALGKRGPWTPEEVLQHYPLEAAKPAAAPATATTPPPAPAGGLQLVPAAAPAPAGP